MRGARPAACFISVEKGGARHGYCVCYPHHPRAARPIDQVPALLRKQVEEILADLEVEV